MSFAAGWLEHVAHSHCQQQHHHHILTPLVALQLDGFSGFGPQLVQAAAHPVLNQQHSQQQLCNTGKQCCSCHMFADFAAAEFQGVAHSQHRLHQATPPFSAHNLFFHIWMSFRVWPTASAGCYVPSLTCAKQRNHHHSAVTLCSVAAGRVSRCGPQPIQAAACAYLRQQCQPKRQQATSDHSG